MHNNGPVPHKYFFVIISYLSLQKCIQHGKNWQEDYFVNAILLWKVSYNSSQMNCKVTPKMSKMLQQNE